MMKYLGVALLVWMVIIQIGFAQEPDQEMDSSSELHCCALDWLIDWGLL